MRRSGSVPDRLVRDVARVCARAQDPLDLLEWVAARIRSDVPYAAAGWILVDPDTMLMDGVYGEGVDRHTHLELIEAEMSETEDVNRFVEMVDRGVPAASLSRTTGGDLNASRRWRRVYRPRGYGDELRAVFACGSDAWGHACLVRRRDEPDFTAAEVGLLARVAPHVADGIRTGLAVGAVEAPADGTPELIVLRDDGSVESMTPMVSTWFGDPEDESLRSTMVLHQVARRARALVGDGAAGPDPAAVDPAGLDPARAWARTAAGESVIVRGARLGGEGPGRTVLVLDPATRGDLAPLVMRLHQLTRREREVTQMLLTGKTTRAIAADLWITPETLRGHVKNVLAKLAASSRVELVAMLSPEPRSRMRPAEPAGRRSP
ncbi:hypothetical protein GCG21_14330 [Pseudactinotalea sp. HY160]|nr:hypothetical protein [Pseudactinotalea sp. HY160]